MAMSTFYTCPKINSKAGFGLEFMFGQLNYLNNF